MNIKVLKSVGLTEGEIKVYLSLLEIGSSTTGPIIEKCGVARSIIYQILEKLIQKGLVSYIFKEKTKYFQAAPPQKILDYIDAKEKELEKNRIEVENMLPDMLMRQNSKQGSEAQIFKGFKGIQTVHENTYSKLKKGEEFFYLGIPGFQAEKYHIYWNKDHKKRVKAGIKCKLLFNIGTPIETLKNRNSFKGCDSRYMPINIKTPAWFLGYKDVIVIGLQSKEIAIEIVDQEIADSFRAYFEEFWKQTKKVR